MTLGAAGYGIAGRKVAHDANAKENMTRFVAGVHNQEVSEACGGSTRALLVLARQHLR